MKLLQQSTVLEVTLSKPALSIQLNTCLQGMTLTVSSITGFLLPPALVTREEGEEEKGLAPGLLISCNSFARLVQTLLKTCSVMKSV